MNRRKLLGGVATGLAAGLAGCGFAYGPGDLRERQFLSDGSSLVETRDTMRDGDRILLARQFDNTDVPPSQGENPPDSQIKLSAFNLDGEAQWEYSRAGTYTAATLAGDGAYLVDEQSRIEAIRPAGDDAESEREWSVELETAGPPIAGSPELVAVTTDDGVAAVGETLLWERAVTDVQDLFVLGRATVILRENGVQVIDESGTETYHRTGDGLLVTADTERLYVTDKTELWAVDPTTGERLWDHPAEGLWTMLTVEGEVLGLCSTSETRTVTTTGTPLWETGVPTNGTPRPDTSVSTNENAFLPASEWGYYVQDCVLHGFSPDGQQWSRKLNLCPSKEVCDECQPIDGWIDGERVCYLFESGQLLRIQRTDQRHGLFW